MKLIVYVDALIFENFCMNYLLLYIINRFCRCRTKWWRIVLAALIGSVYVLLAFYPALHIFYTILMKVLMSILMIIIAFCPYELKKLLKLTVLFYIETFIIGGTILGLFYITNYNIDIVNGAISFSADRLTSTYKIVGIMVAIILVKFGFDYFENYYSSEKNKLQVEIFLGDKKSGISALVDTGNSLKDPITNLPIFVVYMNAVLEIFPDTLKSALSQIKSYNDITSSFVNSPLSTRMRLIPYNAVGVENGLLVGIRTDMIKVTFKTKEVTLRDWVIAIYNKPVSADSTYEAIVSSDIMKNYN